MYWRFHWRKRKRADLTALLNFLTGAYLIFAPSISLGADLCEKVFLSPEKAITLQDSEQVPDLLSIKKTERLNPKGEDLRQRLVDAGVIDTTTGRSEFKHYLEESVANDLIGRLAKEFPAQFSIEGTLISGLAPRDGIIKLSTEDLEALPIMNQILFGKKVFDVVKEQGLINALRTPLVYSQKREELRSRLFRIVGHIRADQLLKQVDELNIKAVVAAAENPIVTYTDTASSSKFSYNNKLGRDAIAEQAQILKLQLGSLIISKLEKVDFANLTDSQAVQLIDFVLNSGIKKTDAEKLVDNLREAALDEGVVRYRKYRVGGPNTSFDKIPSPGLDQKTSNQAIKDGAFADQITWVEFKMKNTKGEVARRTAGNKPRFPIPDFMVYLLKDRSRFVSDSQFTMTKSLLKMSIREAVDVLKSRGVKEAKYNEEQIDLAIEFARQLHLQNFSFEPVGRTVYTRNSFNLNIPDQNGKIQNIQITRDHDVWELSRKTGTLVQALPYVAKEQDVHFHYNPETGWYESVSNPNAKLVFNPRSPELVYQVVEAEKKLVNVKVEPVEVDELKVPLQFIKLSDHDIAQLPQLASVAKFRADLIEATENLNRRRAQYNLDAFEIDKGKRSSSRKDLSGGFKLFVHPKFLDEKINSKNLREVQFKFHPESGYWVAWGQKTNLIYHPSFGVLRLDRGSSSSQVLPVYYERSAN